MDMPSPAVRNDAIEALRNLPAEMRSQKRWLVWKSVSNGDKKPKKMPFYISGEMRRGPLDGPQDMQNLATFERAIEAFSTGDYQGIGFALGGGCGLGGLDLDNCIKNDGSLTDEAVAIVTQAETDGNYIEISPSGSGIRVIGYADKFPAIKANGYEAYYEGRFLTITGNTKFIPQKLGPLFGALACLKSAAKNNRDTVVAANKNYETEAYVFNMTPSGRTEGEERIIVEGERNNTLASFAGVFRKQGKDENEIYSLLQQINRTIVVPPLPDREVEMIARSIGKYPILAAAQDFAAAASLKTNEFNLVPISNLLALPAPPRWLISKYLLLDTVNMLFGEPGVGKSLLALSWAAHVALGRQWCGQEVKQGSVIYCCGEGNYGMRYRSKALENDLGILLREAPLYFSTGSIPLPKKESIEKIIEAVEATIQKHGIPVLLIVDTLARHFGGGEENVTRDMNLFIDALEVLRQKYGCCVLVVHHSGHNNKERARGGSSLPAAIDRSFLFERDGARLRLVSGKTKDYDGPKADKVFTIESVPLPVEWGEDGKSGAGPVLVEVKDTPPRNVMLSAKLIKAMQRSMLSLDELLAANGKPVPSALGIDESKVRGRKVVLIAEWKENYISRYKGKQSGAARTFNRDRKELESERKVKTSGGWVWIPLEDEIQKDFAPTN